MPWPLPETIIPQYRPVPFRTIWPYPSDTHLGEQRLLPPQCQIHSRKCIISHTIRGNYCTTNHFLYPCLQIFMTNCFTHVISTLAPFVFFGNVSSTPQSHCDFLFPAKRHFFLYFLDLCGGYPLPTSSLRAC